MPNANLQGLVDFLSSKEEYLTENKLLNITKISQLAREYDVELLEFLQSNEEIKKQFFVDVAGGIAIFKLDNFLFFINNREFLPNSFTAFKNKIGLATDKDNYLANSGDVVLNWAYKDCILEGGQTKEDQKRGEVFFNEILAPNQINRLLDDKVFTNFKRYDKNGKHEVKELNKNDNLIIKGNNLVVLHSLKKRFTGKVKLIYIDPPYNTGNDGFKYNDNFNHSSWLTFMKNRLEVARELLADDGVIFVSLDDKENHYCKILMDEIFGRENFVADICHKSRGSISNDKIISPNHNHILFYAKKERIIFAKKENFGIEKSTNGFKFKDEKGEYKLVPVDGPGGDIKGNPHYEFLGIEGYWRFSKERMQKMYDEGLIVKTASSLQQKYYKEKALLTKQTVTTWWDENFLTSSATSELKKMMQDDVFKNPKNEYLIKRIIEISTQEEDLVLDYHLGSGTTAAVAHKMNRQYIGIEQMDYIETVSIERMKKVIEGEQGGISESVNWQGGGEFVYCELANDAENFRNEVRNANAKELAGLLEKAKKSSFLSYRVDRDKFNGFENLTEQEQRELLCSLVDANTLYINYSDIENADYEISETDKKLNKQFYGK
jgi:adenine-specific DNA-methyltransferase